MKAILLANVKRWSKVVEIRDSLSQYDKHIKDFKIDSSGPEHVRAHILDTLNLKQLYFYC
jgi:hypothetical protein